MNTEEIMKLADAYADACLDFALTGKDTATAAHAALEAALSAKQGEQDAVCPLCHGKGEHEMFSAHLPGQPVPERRMVKCNQCANPAPSVNAQERISELEAECERLNQQAELQYQHDTKEIEELQAQNAQLLEALKRILGAGGLFSEPASGQHAREIARAAIAAVESLK